MACAQNFTSSHRLVTTESEVPGPSAASSRRKCPLHWASRNRGKPRRQHPGRRRWRSASDGYPLMSGNYVGLRRPAQTPTTRRRVVTIRAAHEAQRPCVHPRCRKVRAAVLALAKAMGSLIRQRRIGVPAICVGTVQGDGRVNIVASLTRFLPAQRCSQVRTPELGNVSSSTPIE